MPTCERCTRRGTFQVVNNDERDGFACSRHLAAVVRRMTETGWVKVDRSDASDDNNEGEQ